MTLPEMKSFQADAKSKVHPVNQGVHQTEDDRVERQRVELRLRERRFGGHLGELRGGVVLERLAEVAHRRALGGAQEYA